MTRDHARGRRRPGDRPLWGMAMVAAALLAGCGGPGAGPGAHDEPHADHAPERGPQGGRLFGAGDLRLELVIAEDGIPPEFRAFLYDGRGARLPHAEARLSVVLERFAGRRDSLTFRPEPDFLRSNGVVSEPHSFDARITLEWRGRRETWGYEQREGRVELTPAAVAAGGIETALAGPRAIEVRVRTPGEVRLNAERVVQVRPRFPGVVREMTARLGDGVAAGDRLAAIHSNESLTDYRVDAPMRGTIVSRDASVGQGVDATSVLYTIADLSTVWVDFALYPEIAGRVRRGQPVRIHAGSTDLPPVSTTIHYVGPLLEQDTRVSYGRVVLPNGGGGWTPGLFVDAAIAVDRFRAAVAVPEEAIVRTSRGPGVFRAMGASFELQPVVPGRSDGDWTEIVEGLEPGARVVVRNAFLLKAELGKSEATHDH